MIPQSAQMKKNAKTAQAMIRDFGGNAVIDAEEAAVTGCEGIIRKKCCPCDWPSLMAERMPVGVFHCVEYFGDESPRHFLVK